MSALKLLSGTVDDSNNLTLASLPFLPVTPLPNPLPPIPPVTEEEWRRALDGLIDEENRAYFERRGIPFPLEPDPPDLPPGDNGPGPGSSPVRPWPKFRPRVRPRSQSRRQREL